MTSEEDKSWKAKKSDFTDCFADSGEIDHWSNTSNSKDCGKDITEDQSNKNIQVFVYTMQ